MHEASEWRVRPLKIPTTGLSRAKSGSFGLGPKLIRLRV